MRPFIEGISICVNKLAFQELRKQFQENITRLFDGYKEQFNVMRDNYNVQMNLLMTGKQC